MENIAVGKGFDVKQPSPHSIWIVSKHRRRCRAASRRTASPTNHNRRYCYCAKICASLPRLIIAAQRHTPKTGLRGAAAQRRCLPFMRRPHRGQSKYARGVILVSEENAVSRMRRRDSYRIPLLLRGAAPPSPWSVCAVRGAAPGPRAVECFV